MSRELEMLREMPDDVKPDDPSDSAETLRIMADLERYADMHAPTLSDSADVMDEARHRLAVLQQACNAYPGLVARVAALEAENAKLREALADMLSGWRYIRMAHGDLYGVGWDRCEKSASAALSPKEPQ